MGITNITADLIPCSDNTINISDSSGTITISNGMAMSSGTTMGSAGYWLTIDSGTGSLVWNYPYENERKIYGDELVDKFMKMKEMSVEEFAKSEFYKDLLNGNK